jgi:hypothetical protein
MPTTTHIRRGAALRRTALFTLLLCVLATPALAPRPAAHQTPSAAEEELDGRDEYQPDSKLPKIEAFFAQDSYRPGDLATLQIWSPARGVTVQIWRAGAQAHRIRSSDEMDGLPVSRTRLVGTVATRRTIVLHVGDWPSGLYFARLAGDGQKLGFAPFVLAPRHLGEHRVAVVLPTQTWQAYNFRDDDGDGAPNTWYGDSHVDTVLLQRPLSNRGVPNHYKFYDDPFQRWLIKTGKQFDELSDGDLAGIGSARALAKAYDLIVFPGHHEYVTKHEYDLITRYRDLGGHLMFLSANNFFWRVDRDGDRTITRVAKWRDLGRPEAALIGIQYFHNDLGEQRGAWVVRRGATAQPWIFAGAERPVGSRLSNGGIEADARAAASPPNLTVLAEIPDLYGPGLTAQMSYYDTPRGAKVFAAGAFSLAAAIGQPDVKRVIENLFDGLESR